MALRIAILANAESWYGRDLERAARSRGHIVRCHPFANLQAGTVGCGAPVAVAGDDLASYDAVLVRTMPPGSLEQVVFRMNVLAQLERRGVLVVNPARSLECAVDKYLTTIRLEQAGLPVPETIVCESADDALLAFERLGRDVVVKPIFGSEGRGIVRVSDPDLAVRVFRTLERIGAVLYVQRFIPHPGYDVRVMVLDGQVVGGMRRHNPDDFRTNVSRQGRAERVELTAQQSDWAIRATDAVGAHVAGVDLLTDEAGREYVIEVNGVPGWRAFNPALGVDMADKLIASIERQRGR